MTTFKTVEDAKARLAQKIVELKKEISESAQHTEEEMLAAQKAVVGLVESVSEDMTEAQKISFSSDLEKYDSANKLKNLLDTLKMFTETLASDELMVINTDYLLVPNGGSLMSVAGFHPSERVFLKIEGGIPTDKLPNTNMKYFDLRLNCK